MTMQTQTRNQPRNGAEAASADDNEVLEGNSSIGFSLPIAMKVELEKAAIAANKAPNAFVREIVAQHIGYALPASKSTARGSKYESPEAKKAAQQKTAKEHRERMAALLNRSRREAGVPVPEKAAAKE